VSAFTSLVEEEQRPAAERVAEGLVMNVAIFGSFGKRMLAPGWTKQTALAFLGGGDIDLVGVAPGEGAQLTAIAIFGGIDIIVDPGTQVTMTGFSLFGSRDVEVVPADGPVVLIRGFAVFGSVDVKTPGA
jgi:hypothetical protein